MSGFVNNVITANSATINSTTCDSSGRWLYPGQPAFLAYLANQLLNVTGASTTYTVLYDTTVYNIGSGYNTGTGDYTAPLTGKYQISAGLYLGGLAATNTTGQMSIISSNGNYFIYDGTIGGIRNTSSISCISGSMLIDMDAADTVHINIFITGGTKVIDILVSNRSSYFAGRLVQ